MSWPRTVCRSNSSLVRMRASLSWSPRRRKKLSEFPAVRLEKNRLEAFDLALLLQPRVIFENLVEYLDGLPLTARHRGPETDE